MLTRHIPQAPAWRPRSTGEHTRRGAAAQHRVAPARRFAATGLPHWLGLDLGHGSSAVTQACLVFFALVALLIVAATGSTPFDTELRALLWGGCALEGLLLALIVRASLESRSAQTPAATLVPARDPPAGRHGAEHAAELEKVVAQLRERQVHLEAQANHDDLTGLANRKLLQDRFRCAAERAKRSGKCFALLMIDLDRFKAINDTHGHTAGDTVLVTVARRMVAALRTCDTVARLGGDEFVLIVESIHNPSEIIPIGRKLVHTLLDDIRLGDGATVSVGASLGLALYPHDGTNLADMLDVADSAMYQCKASGQMELLANPPSVA